MLRALRAREATGAYGALEVAARVALVPSSTFVNVRAVPHVALRRFTPCGRFLIAMSRNQRDVVVYRFESGGVRRGAPSEFFEEAPWHDRERRTAPDSRALLASLPLPVPSNAPRTPRVGARYSCHFARFFTELFVVEIARGSELMVREFCLVTAKGRYLILASFQAGQAPAAAPEPLPLNAPLPAVASVPVLESFTLHLFDLETGRVADRFTLTDDYVQLDGHAGVHMYQDMLCVLSIRYQVLHFLRIQENLGRFTREACIGTMCRPDDDLEIARARDTEAAFKAQLSRFSPAAGAGDVPEPPPPEPVVPSRTDSETGLGNGKLQSGFYTGLMQRLLVHVFRQYHREGNSLSFFRVIGQYSMLVMLKAQFLDGDHLLIRLGSQEGSGKALDPAAHTCFFLVYCISTTRIVNVYENRSTELLNIYEKYRDFFITDAAVSATLPPVSSGRVATNVGGRGASSHARGASSHARGANRASANRAGLGPGPALSQRTRSALAVLPVSSQSRNVSVYLDRSIFSYDSDKLPALDGTRPMSLRELSCIKFTSVRSGALRFKLTPGIPIGGTDGGGGAGGDEGEYEGVLAAHGAGNGRKKALFLFHPILPFVISMEQSLLTPTLFNFHVSGYRD